MIGERQIAALVDAIEDAVTVRDTAGRVVYSNAAAQALEREGAARAPGRHRGADPATGASRWLETRHAPLAGTDLVLEITRDVTAAARAEQGRRLLGGAGRLLSDADDVPAALERIAALAVPDLVDRCAIDLPGPSGFLRCVAVPDVPRLPVHIDDEELPATVIRTGVPHRGDGELVVPLRSGGDVLGALTLAAPGFDDADVELAEALARRIGDALRNARLIQDRTEIAHVLSAGLRPEASPVVPGCEVAAVYEPAGDDVEAGGDFYEVIDAPSRTIVVMGDVVGKGAPAAALSAVARVTLRTAGRLTAEPRAALDELNHMLRRRGSMSLCTVAAVALPSELPGTAELLLAGHPPPLLLRDGAATPVGRPGPLLGALEVADWPATTVELAPNDVLVLYTDGVLDGVLPGGRRFGEARLRALAERAGGDVDAIAAALRLEVRDMRLRDDVALLAIRCPGPPPLLARGTLDGDAEAVLALSLPGGPIAPRSARHALDRALAGRLGERARADALIVVSELVTNAIRHGGARTETDAVDVHAALVPTGLRIEVTDPGPGFEPGGHGPRPDGGYGLHLLDRLATRWGVAGGDPVTVWVELAS